MTARNRKLGLAEAAKDLGIPYQQARRLLLLGVLQGDKRGGRWLVRSSHVRRLAKSGALPRLVNRTTIRRCEMNRDELEGLVSTYQGDFAEIENVLEDDGLTTSEKVDAIADVVYGDDDADDAVEQE